MEPIDYMGALRRSWRLFLALGVVGLIVGLLLPVSPPKAKTHSSAFEWNATMIVGSAPSGPTTALGGGVTDSQVQFYAGSSAVRANTLNTYGIEGTTVNMAVYLSSAPAGVLKKHGAQTVPVLLTAQGTTPVAAANLVATYSEQLGDYLVNLVSTKQSQKNNSGGNVTTNSIGFQVLQPPIVGVNASGAKKTHLTSSRKVRGVIGLVIGLLLAGLIVLARELLDKRIRSSDRAESTFGYPVVAEIPGEAKFRGGFPGDLDVVGKPDSVAAEAYRMLRMSVLFEALAPKATQPTGIDALLTSGMGLGNGAGVLGNGNGAGIRTNGAGNGSSAKSSRSDDAAEEPSVPADYVGNRQVVLVISAGTEPTRPLVAANFAAVYAEAGERAVVISTAELGTGRSVPTGSVTGEIRPEDIESRLEASRVENVLRLPLSDFVENSGQLVTRAPAVIEATRSVADVIVVEAPPLLAVHHAEALSHAVDVVLVVGESWATTYDDARRAGELLRRMDAPVLGVVLTNVHVSRRDTRHAHTFLKGGAPDPVEEATTGAAGQPVADLSAAGAGTHTQA